jgi:type IV secretion system protein VirB3
MHFRMRVRNLQQNDGMWVFSPNSYRYGNNKT